MLEYILNNIGTISVALIVALIVGAVIAVMIRDKKSGKSSCGGGCSGCPYSGKCHGEDGQNTCP